MCKFGNSENMTYQNVVMRIEEMLEKVSGTFPEESSTPNSTPASILHQQVGGGN